ncbi:hypothetical protein C8039_14210 [Halogeometricum sp. wsp3]|nr:hypothetical protein C8039_14210 [Halogeometricum sp. wsp3]
MVGLPSRLSTPRFRWSGRVVRRVRRTRSRLVTIAELDAGLVAGVGNLDLVTVVGLALRSSASDGSAPLACVSRATGFWQVGQNTRPRPDALRNYLRMESRMLGHQQDRARRRAEGFLELLAEIFIAFCFLAVAHTESSAPRG